MKAYAEAYQVASSIWGPSSPKAAMYEVDVAKQHRKLGDCASATREAEHVRTLMSPTLAPASSELLTVDEVLGDCATLANDHERGLREYTRRLDALRTAHRDHSIEMGDTMLDLGDLEVHRKNFELGARELASAVAVYEEVLGTSDRRLANPLLELANAQVEAGHATEAIPTAEHALTILIATKASAVATADAQFRLARALVRDPGRARALATEAGAALRAAGSASAAKIETWLEGHAVNHSSKKR